MSEKVRVSVVQGPEKKPEIWTVDRPAIHDNSCTIEVRACGVCGTDVHIYEGKWPKNMPALPWPITLGHEVAGVVGDLGKGVKKDYMGNELKEGDKITIPPVIPCGQCYFCKHYPTRSNKCRSPIYYGRTIPAERPPHLWGGWAEEVFVDFDQFPSTTIYRLPDSWPETLGALVEPLTACLRALERGMIGLAHGHEGYGPGSTVVIQGSGAIGLFTLICARETGAKKVIVIGAPERPRLELCREFGADATIDITKVDREERIAKVFDLTNGLGADVVVDCTGYRDAPTEGIEMVRDAGTYVEMGQVTDVGPVPTNWSKLTTKDLTVVGSFAYTPNNIPDAISLIDRALHRYQWRKIQTDNFRLEPEEIVSAIRMAQGAECMKASIIP